MPRLSLAAVGCTWFIFSLLSTSCGAQTAQVVDDKPAVPPDDCLRRSIPLTVVNNPENAELKVDQLQVQSNGAKISVASLSRPRIAPRVLLLLDTSGSMAEDGRTGWATTLLAAGFALDTIPDQSPVALVSFSNQTNITGFEDRKQVQERLVALGEAEPHGQTALYAAVQRAIAVFGVPQFGDTILLLTDGGNNISTTRPDAVARELIGRGIRLFAFVVGNNLPAASPDVPLYPPGACGQSGCGNWFTLPWSEPAVREFRDFVDSAGGTWMNVRITSKWLGSKEAPEVLKAIRDQLQSPYRLDLQLATPVFKPAKLKIKSELKEVELSYPRQIEPCSTLSAATHP